MKSKSERLIQVCPNCGHRVKTSDFFSKNWLAWEGQQAISGVFTCPKCGYYGLPVEVKERDLPKIKFSNKPMGRPVFRKMNWLSYLMLLGVLGWILFLLIFAFPVVVALAVLLAILAAIKWLFRPASS